MNNRRTAPGGQMTHMLSTILAKVTNIEKLLAPAIHNLPDSEILDSKGVRLLTKMSDRTLLRRRNDGSLPFHRDKGKIYYRRSDSKGRHEVRMPALLGMAGDCFRPFLFHSGVFCLFLAVAQRLSNQ